MAQAGVAPAASGGSKPRWSSACLPGRTQGRSRTGNRLRPPLRGGARARPFFPLAYPGDQVAPDGVEPSFPGCRPGVVAVGPRGCVAKVESPGVAPGSSVCDADVFLLDHDPKSGSRGSRTHKRHNAAACFPSRFLNHSDGFHRHWKAEVVGLEPTSGFEPPPVFRTGSSSGRMTSVLESCGSWT